VAHTPAFTNANLPPFIETATRSPVVDAIKGAAIGTTAGAVGFGASRMLYPSSSNLGAIDGGILGGIIGIFHGYQNARSQNRWVNSAQQLEVLDKSGQLLPVNLLNNDAVRRYAKPVNTPAVVLSRALTQTAMMGALSGVFSLFAGASPTTALISGITEGAVFGVAHAGLTYNAALDHNERHKAVEHYINKAKENDAAITHVERLQQARTLAAAGQGQAI
jgi:hypothetical protein